MNAYFPQPLPPGHPAHPATAALRQAILAQLFQQGLHRVAPVVGHPGLGYGGAIPANPYAGAVDPGDVVGAIHDLPMPVAGQVHGYDPGLVDIGQGAPLPYGGWRDRVLPAQGQALTQGEALRQAIVGHLAATGAAAPARRRAVAF